MKAVLVLIAIAAVGSFAQAEQVLTSTKPTAIPVAQVLKAKGFSAKCNYQKMGETGRYKNVKGSKTFFAATMPKEDTKAVDAIADGKAVYVCKSVQFDHAAGKIVNADN